MLHLVSSLVTDTDGILENNAISYNELKGTLQEHFCGTEYNNNLESKLRTLAWTKKDQHKFVYSRSKSVYKRMEFQIPLLYML